MTEANKLNTVKLKTSHAPCCSFAWRVTELWDGVTKAQESDAADNDTISDQIDHLRIAMAETAGFAMVGVPASAPSRWQYSRSIGGKP